MRNDYYNKLMDEHRKKQVKKNDTEDKGMVKKNLPSYLILGDAPEKGDALPIYPPQNKTASLLKSYTDHPVVKPADDYSSERLNALNNFISYFFEQESIEEAVTSVFTTASSIFAAQAVQFMYLDEAQETFFIYSVNSEGILEDNSFFIYPGTIYENLIQTRKNIVVRNLEAQKEYITGEPLQKLAFKSMMQISCIIKNKLIGFLNFFSDIDDAFKNSDIEQADSLAKILSAYTQNIVIIEEMKLAQSASAKTFSSTSRNEAMMAKFLETEIENVLREQKENLVNLGKKNIGLLTPKQNDFYQPSLEATVTTIKKIEQAQEYLYMVSGKIIPELKKLEPTKILSDACSAMQSRIDEKTARVLLESDKKLPHIIADQRLLKRVLTALIENALEKTKIGGMFKLGAFVEGDKVEFVIWDFGIEPISQDDFVNLFTPFAAFEHTLSNKRGKRFLNLPLVKMYVELMGGKIKVESSKENGTIFSVYIPCR